MHAQIHHNQLCFPCICVRTRDKIHPSPGRIYVWQCNFLVFMKSCFKHGIATYRPPFSSVCTNRNYFDTIRIPIYQQEQNYTPEAKMHVYRDNLMSSAHKPMVCKKCLRNWIKTVFGWQFFFFLHPFRPCLMWRTADFRNHHGKYVMCDVSRVKSLDIICARCIISQIAKFMRPTWGPPGSCRPQMGPMNFAIRDVSEVTSIFDN